MSYNGLMGLPWDASRIKPFSSIMDAIIEPAEQSIYHDVAISTRWLDHLAFTMRSRTRETKEKGVAPEWMRYQLGSCSHKCI